VILIPACAIGCHASAECCLRGARLLVAEDGTSSRPGASALSLFLRPEKTPFALVVPTLAAAR
jgi:hypothetical protein